MKRELEEQFNHEQEHLMYTFQLPPEYHCVFWEVAFPLKSHGDWLYLLNRELNYHPEVSQDDGEELRDFLDRRLSRPNIKDPRVIEDALNRISQRLGLPEPAKTTKELLDALPTKDEEVNLSGHLSDEEVREILLNEVLIGRVAKGLLSRSLQREQLEGGDKSQAFFQQVVRECVARQRISNLKSSN